MTKYYFAGSQRVATLAPGASAGVRKNGTLYYLLDDHASTGSARALGSTSITTDVSRGFALEIQSQVWSSAAPFFCTVTGLGVLSGNGRA